ncbi:hypothetical protein ACH5RR_037594 [Cinchona calisaya]|uniref:Uncharacterized protein n=1 Tax=Cinchona calisaya TaxID=153742 RepID=A0ABD2YAC9_9GENT
MDLKSKGRTWVGNIFHKFEAIRQEVDDFVSKDTIKYVENQMQTVGGSVRKIYSNVMHDFHPPSADNEQGKSESMTLTQNNALVTNIPSLAGVKEKHKHASERESSKEQDAFNLKSWDPSEVDHLGQFSPPSSADSPQVAENYSHCKETNDAAMYNKTELALEDNFMREDYPATSCSSSPNDDNSPELALFWREQHLLSENLESVDGNLSGPSDIFNDGDQRNVFLAEFSPRNLVEDVKLKISPRNKTTCSSADLSEEAGSGLFLEQDAETATYNKSEMGPEENASVEEHPATEHASSFEGKNLWESLWTQEEDPAGFDFYALEDKSSSIRSSADEDHKIVDLVKRSPEVMVPDSALRVVPVKQEADSNANPSEEALTNLYLQHDGHVGYIKCGMDPVANVRKEHLVVDNGSCPGYESSSDLSLYSREKHPESEDSNSLQDKSLYKPLDHSTTEDYWLTILAKLHRRTSVNDEGLRVFQEEGGEYTRPYNSNETETNLSLHGYCSCMASDPSVEENGCMGKRAAPENLGCSEHKSSCNSLCSRKLHVDTGDFDSPNGENSSGLSLISRTKDHRSTTPTKFLPVNSVNDAALRASQKDETTCTIFSDVLSTNLSTELVSSGNAGEHKVAETKASTSSVSTELIDLLKFSCGNSTQKTEEVCCEYTDSGGCESSPSSISCASFSGLTSSNKAVNLIPAFPRTASSADASSTNESMFESSGYNHQQFFEAIVDDSVNDIAYADMETIDLSDEAKLEESCIVVDNEPQYSASFRPRKFRSYKKLIQEAFASRKRLVKEYEQLAIWHGDIDTDTSFQSEQRLLPRMPSISRPSQARDLGESEWELL